jgi:hypothetical protein
MRQSKKERGENQKEDIGSAVVARKFIDKPTVKLLHNSCT